VVVARRNLARDGAAERRHRARV